LLKQEQTPGGNVMRRKKRITRFKRFVDDIFIHTPFVKMIFLLISLWLIFSAGLYTAEHGIEGSSITSYGRALYWGIAAFSTAGIADTPVSGISQIIGGIWIVAGSALFFGTIVATITTYFMRPLHRPAKQIIDTIEYNLEQLDDLSIEELDLLKKTTDGLILHMEHLKKKQKNKAHNKPRF
jgi:voltage-gated potassium channel